MVSGLCNCDANSHKQLSSSWWCCVGKTQEREEEIVRTQAQQLQQSFGQLCTVWHLRKVGFWFKGMKWWLDSIEQQTRPAMPSFLPLLLLLTFPLHSILILCGFHSEKCMARGLFNQERSFANQPLFHWLCSCDTLLSLSWRYSFNGIDTENQYWMVVMY